jgi:hypothetical protein
LGKLEGHPEGFLIMVRGSSLMAWGTRAGSPRATLPTRSDRGASLVAAGDIWRAGSVDAVKDEGSKVAGAWREDLVRGS